MNDIAKEVDLVQEEAIDEDGENINEWKINMKSLREEVQSLIQIASNFINEKSPIVNDEEIEAEIVVEEILDSSPDDGAEAGLPSAENEPKNENNSSSTDQSVGLEDLDFPNTEKQSNENIKIYSSNDEDSSLTVHPSMNNEGVEVDNIKTSSDSTNPSVGNATHKSPEKKSRNKGNGLKDEISEDYEREESFSEKLGMKERKHRLCQVKLKMASPTDYNFKDCPLRLEKRKSKNCKCRTTKHHCYFCLAHVCQDCSANKDELEAGVRKCAEGECQFDVVKKWEQKESSEKQKVPPKKAKEKVTPSRCKSCSACSETCEKLGKTKDWCKVCLTKKTDIDKATKARRGCENRGLCLKFINSEDGKMWQKLQESLANNKRKTDDSPPMKQASKIVKEEQKEKSPELGSNKSQGPNKTQ